jgi:uncharacterized repeat protein (TIGR01451 family)
MPALAHNYGGIPLSFEAGEQQSFVAHGRGFALALDRNGATFCLRSKSAEEKDSEPLTVRMNLKEARTDVMPQGLDELDGKVNHLNGGDPQKWRTNIHTFRRVSYSGIYPGIDLVYYGNQKELEYDFQITPGANPSRIRWQFDRATELSIEGDGSLIVKAGAEKLKLLKPDAYQETTDGTREKIESRYQIIGRSGIQFLLGAYDHRRPLVIDPVLAYSTFLGGTDDDEAYGIAVDSTGNAYITGETFSVNFPVTTFQTSHNQNYDAFVTKINPAGTAIVYSTFVGGSGFESGNAIAIDAAGNAYVTGQTTSTDFPLVAPLQTTNSGTSDVFVFELNSAGTGLVYSTYLGGSSFDSGNSIAVDQAGNTYVAGESDSRDFPTTNALQSAKPGNAIFRTVDGASNWAASDTGLLASSVNGFAFDPANTNVVYTACDNGVAKSTDGGVTWNSVLRQVATPVQAIAINPSNTSVLYVATSGGLYKSVDGGNTFSLLSAITAPYRSVVVDPITPANVYAASSSFIARSTDGGATWSSNGISGASSLSTLALDPATPSTIYVGTNRGIFKSTNSGVTFAAANAGIQSDSVRGVAVDRNNPSTVYFASNLGIRKSTNGGTSWTSINGNLGSIVQLNGLVLDPNNTNVIYVTETLTVFGVPLIQKTTDGGANWNPVANGFPSNIVPPIAINPGQSSILLAGANTSAEGFVTKIGPGGAPKIYSTYLGGAGRDVVLGITADSTGRAYVTGITSSADLPVKNAFQPARADNFAQDAFLTIFNSNGSLASSSFLGGDSSDVGRAIALDGSNNIYLAGYTSSVLFPGAGGPQPTITGGSSDDVFVTKFNPGASAILYTTSIGGSGSDQCFGLAVDANGAAYITGTTSSPDYPVAGASQPAKGGNSDAFVTKLNSSGAISYSTYLGGGGSDTGRGIAIDGAGNAYVAGFTSSLDFPTVNPISKTFGGIFDVFVAKVGVAPDIVVTMTGGSGPVNFGSQLTYNITVANNGEAPAAGVQLIDTLMSGGGVVSVNTNRGSCSGNRIVNCDLGTLNVGESAAITLVALPPAVTTMMNSATASTTTAESTTTNNTATVNTPVLFNDVMVKNTSALPVTEVGAVDNYIVTVTNKGPAAATTIVVTDNLPAQLSFVSCATTVGACGGSGNSPTVSVNSLAVGSSFTATIGARVNSGVSPGTIISNTASMTSAIPDINPNNDAQTALTTVKAAAGLGNQNGVIAFSSNAGDFNSGNQDIYIVNPDGTGLRNISYDNILSDQWPAWSPDGTKIVFSTEISASPRGLWLMNADGSGKTQLTSPNTSNNDTNASWSPDGTRIIFNGTRANLTGLLMINADGTQLRSLPGISGAWPAWSPDGTRIAFSDGIGLQVVFADGSGKTKIVSGNNSGSSWSPDGTKLVFSQSDSSPGGISLYIVNVDGTGLTQISNSSGGGSPSWSPDGTKIAFGTSGVTGGITQGIYTINIDGTGLTKISGNLPGVFNPRWQRRPANSSPLSPTFNISGHVTNAANGTAVTTQAISLTGGQTRAVQTNQNGDYIFWGLPTADYTLAAQFDPIFSAGATSNPANRVFNNLSADQTGADFAITFQPRPPLTGFVKDANGGPLANVRVSLRNSVTNADVFTDSSGFYTFGTTFVGPIAFVIVVPQDSYSNYVFNPPIIQNLTRHLDNNNFNGYPMTASLSGKVSVGGVGKPGINVGLGQPQPLSATTDANGNYSFSNIGNGLPLSVTVDTTTYPFSPATQTATVTGQTTGVNFDAPANQYSISGGVSQPGAALSGVTLTLSGGGNATTLTDSQGAFSFPLQAGGAAYNVTPSKPGYTFSPASTSIANLNSNTRLGFGWVANTISFAGNSITVSETDGKATLNVVRSGTLSQTVTVDYRTNDGTASQRSDYTFISGTLTFAPQEQSKTITIPISVDSLVEGDETFTVTLSNPVGAIIADGGGTSTITIIDDDTATPVVNPMDNAGLFTQQQYFDFLSRVPDSSGLAFWTQSITDCGLDKACVEVHRINASGAFFLSIEFQQTGYLVERIYKTAYGDASCNSTFPSAHQLAVPVVRLSEFLPDTQAIGQGVVVLAPGWEQTLETNKQNFVSAFVQRARFTTAFPTSLTPATFVDTLNSNAGHPLSQPERDQLVSDLTNSVKTRAQVLRAIAEHQNLVTAETSRAFVLMQYFGYLRRNPNDTPDSDYSGFNFWLTKLNQFNGDYIAAEMVKAFISSTEYRQRFGP